MFGAFFSFLSTLQSFKVKKTEEVKKKVERMKQKETLSKKLNLLQNKNEEKKDNKSQDSNNKISKEKAKLLLLRIITAVVTVIENLVIWIVSLIGVLGFFIIMAAVVVLIIVMGLLSILDENELDNKDMTNIPDGMSSYYRSELQWTEDELLLYSSYLNNKEQNIFRMLILYNKLHSGDYGTSFFNTGYQEKEGTLAYLLGFTAVESSMTFYTDPELEQSANIFKTPSDIKANSLNYAFLGLHKDGTLETYGGKATDIPTTTVKNIKDTWQPDSTPLYVGNYAPYGTAMQVKQLESKLSFVEGRLDKVNTYIDEAMAAYNIKENKEELRNFIILFLTSGGYHGYEVIEYEGYISFWCALWASTSTVDKERGFDNISIVDSKNTFDESSFRKQILSYHYGLDTDTQALNLGVTFSSPLFEINGVPLTKSIWGYAYEKCGNQDYFNKTAVTTHNSILGGTGGIPDRVLNFHYGLLSYIVGSTLMDRIENKLPLVSQIGGASGEGFMSAKSGEIQGLWKDSGMLEALNKSKYKEFYGQAYAIQNKDEIMTQGVSYETWRNRSKWKVPYYRQTSKAVESSASHKKMKLYLNGCHVYMNSYIASALTGKLINPVEMMDAMLYSDSLQAGNGYYNNTYTNVDNVFDYLGIYAMRGTMSTSTATGDDLEEFEELLGSFDKMDTEEAWKSKVDKLLNLNGMVGLSMGSQQSSSGIRFTEETNHYIVVTEKVGDKYKTMGYGTGADGFNRDMMEHTWEDLYNISLNGEYAGQIYFYYNPNIDSIITNSKITYESFAGVSEEMKNQLLFGKATKPVTASDMSIEDISKKIKTIKVKMWTGEGNKKVSKEVSITVHEALVDNVTAIFNEIYNHSSKPVLNYGGGFNYRTVNNGTNTKTLSNHSFGAAFDFNIDQNPYVSAYGGGDKYNPETDNLSFDENHIVVKTFRKYGWRWGGDYTDYMHFELFGG